MIDLITTADFFPLDTTHNRGLINLFTNQKASLEQQYDMLNFYEIGIKSYHSYIDYYILKSPSTTNVPVRYKTC